MVMTIEEDDDPDDDDVKKQTRIAFKTTCESRSHDMRPRILDPTTCNFSNSQPAASITTTEQLRPTNSRPPNLRPHELTTDELATSRFFFDQQG
ncbi:hypothetical protein F2Q68_00009072 [Brassica cretica]|uniref:Uncharacterized protein n=1 Tax=Brassica cretica TaxID=69181 RepID=A0A8S9KXL2_BRACR|nr:hypothetical protein F2Q68_00009072 [Brassica cretica]